MKNWQDYATDADSGRTKIPIKPARKSPASVKRERQAEQRRRREDLLRWIRVNTVILVIFVIPMVVGLIWGTTQFLRGGNPHNSAARNIGEYIIGGALLGMFAPITLITYLISLLNGTAADDGRALLYLGLFIGVPCVVFLTLANAVRALAQRRVYRGDCKVMGSKLSAAEGSELSRADNARLRKLAWVNFFLALTPPLLALILVAVMLILMAPAPWANIFLFLVLPVIIIAVIVAVVVFSKTAKPRG